MTCQKRPHFPSSSPGVRAGEEKRSGVEWHLNFPNYLADWTVELQTLETMDKLLPLLHTKLGINAWCSAKSRQELLSDIRT
jgi:hypothetical protein